MKLKDKKELFTKSEKELKKMLSEAKEDLFKLIIEHSQRKLKNNKQNFHNNSNLEFLHLHWKCKTTDFIREPGRGQEIELSCKYNHLARSFVVPPERILELPGIAL